MTGLVGTEVEFGCKNVGVWLGDTSTSGLRPTLAPIHPPILTAHRESIAFLAPLLLS